MYSTGCVFQIILYTFTQTIANGKNENKFED